MVRKYFTPLITDYDPLQAGLTGGPKLENIIKQVIESEYRAQKIIDEVEKERKQAAYNIEKEIQRIKEDIFSSARKQAEEVKVEKQKYAKSQAEEIMSHARERTSLMQKKLEKNRDMWVKYLFDNVLNRDS